jgi:hypothetical protein
LSAGFWRRDRAGNREAAAENNFLRIPMQLIGFCCALLLAAPSKRQKTGAT